MAALYPLHGTPKRSHCASLTFLCSLLANASHSKLRNLSLRAGAKSSRHMMIDWTMTTVHRPHGVSTRERERLSLYPHRSPRNKSGLTRLDPITWTCPHRPPRNKKGLNLPILQTS